MRKRWSIVLTVPVYGLFTHLYAYATVPGYPASPTTTGMAVLLVVTISFLCLLGETLVRNSLAYRIVLGVHLSTILIGLNAIGTNPLTSLALVSAAIVSIAFFEDYPKNLVLSLGYALSYGVVGLTVFADSGIASSVGNVIGVLLVCILISLLACHLTMLRQTLIDVQQQATRLEQAIGTLTRANQEYQDYVLRIGAESTERERRRITRDIHDVVGYTLTNNIMLMEAATDVVRSDPIKVTKLLMTARESAQEGLERIRDTLHWFRRNRDFAPYGLSAIAKLVETFQLATGITVDTDYANTPLVAGGEIDSAIYHVVQESMVNALRHGRATKIKLLLMCRAGSQILVEISDNGSTSDTHFASHTDGIGLKGMEERVRKLGGTLRYGPIADGFQVSATIPLHTEGKPNGE